MVNRKASTTFNNIQQYLKNANSKVLESAFFLCGILINDSFLISVDFPLSIISSTFAAHFYGVQVTGETP